MKRTIRPATGVAGTLSLPGDKSISHRYAMLAALARGRSTLTNYSTGADCASTLACMESLGAAVEREGSTVVVEGVGARGLQSPPGPLDAGNSGTTMRLLSGIVAGQGCRAVIGGDESLSERPMKRILTPLRTMGASIDAREDQYPPLRLKGGALEAIRYELPVASAQVKSSVLLAGLHASGTTTVVEPLETRDHSERALVAFGGQVNVTGRSISITGGQALTSCDLAVPGDLSSAVFFLGAALLLPESDLRIERVGLNPTRTAVLSVLEQMGAAIEVELDPECGGEPAGAVVVRGAGALAGGEIGGAVTAGVIDEVPMLAVLGAVSKGGLRIRDAGELRVKETDRIATVTANLRRMGVDVVEHPDGMVIAGQSRLRGAELDSAGDHRIAMAFAVAALAADGPSEMRGADAASVSYPEFYDTLGAIVRS